MSYRIGERYFRSWTIYRIGFELIHQLPRSVEETHAAELDAVLGALHELDVALSPRPAAAAQKRGAL